MMKLRRRLYARRVEKCSQRRMLGGSYTVEAAFLVPIITGMIVVLIGASMYLRDITLVQSVVAEVSEKGRMLVQHEVLPGTNEILYERELKEGIFSRLLGDSNREDEALLLRELEAGLKGRMWLSRCINKKIDIEAGELEISLVVQAGVPTLLFGTGLNSFFRRTVSERTELAGVEEKTRIYSAIVETGMRIKGVEKVIDGLSALIEGR